MNNLETDKKFINNSLYKASERIRWIDALKGLGIILVVLGHTTISEPLSIWIYSFHMPLFFMISGYLYDQRKNITIKRFVWMRMKSLLIPWLFFSFISIIFSYFSDIILYKKSNMLKLLVTFFCGKGVAVNLPLWFLKVLFMVEICFFFIAKLKKKAYIVILLMSIMVSILLMDFSFDVERAIKGFIFYGIGWIVKECWEEIRLNQNNIKFSSMIGGGIISFLLLIWLIIVRILYMIDRPLNIGYMGNIDTILLFIVSILGTIVFVILAVEVQQSAYLCFLGKNSIIILGTHILVMDVISVLMRWIFHLDSEWIHCVDNLQGIMVTIAIILIEIPIIYIVNRWMPFLIGRRKIVIEE